MKLKQLTVTFLHGVNGCGKTTILNIITDILSGNPRLQHYDFKEVRLEYINSHKKAKYISITKQDDTHLIRFQNREFTAPLTSVISAIKAEFQDNHISSNMPNKFLEVLNDFYDTRLLSSGEKRLFTLLSNLASNSTKNIVYLIDEPEHSLHIVITKQYDYSNLGCFQAPFFIFLEVIPICTSQEKLKIAHF